VPSSAHCDNRLTASGVVAEDIEKTAVFHYSKLKQRAASLDLNGIMLHYNVMVPRHLKMPRGHCRATEMERMK
jgi:hypothetical protein